jgi:hypothetical protein
MKKFLVLIVFFSLFIFDVQSQNSFPTSGNVGINLGASTSLNKLQIGSNSQGWSGNDLVLSNSSGSIAIHNDVTHTYLYGTNDIAIRPGFGQMALYAKSNGNVGIGTTAPEQKLDVRGNLLLDAGANPILYTGTGGSELNRFLQLINSSSYGSASGLKAGGILVSDSYSFASPGKNDLIVKGNIGIGTPTPRGKFDIDGPGDIYLSDDVNVGAAQSLFLPGHIYISPHNGGNVSYLQARRLDNSGTTSLRIRTYNSGSLTEAMQIEGNGNVGIGTTTPGNFKLAVNGKIWGTEVQVALTNPGPDYVFEKSYALPTLEEVKSYIDQNKHLPEVPSAKEMETNGVNVGEMNMLLLKKIEELTLYVIEQQKQIEAQASEIKYIKSALK